MELPFVLKVNEEVILKCFHTYLLLFRSCVHALQSPDVSFQVFTTGAESCPTKPPYAFTVGQSDFFNSIWCRVKAFLTS